MTTTPTLEERVRRLEDEAEIRRLVASYGPLVDRGDADGTAALWADDGRYVVDGGAFEARAGVAAMVLSDQHQRLVRNGCAHFLGPLRIDVNGDHARVVCYSLLLERNGDEHVVRRASANRWELRRTDEGWQVAVRTNRRLDGDPAAHALLVTAEAPS